MFRRLLTALGLVATVVITGAALHENRAGAESQVIAPTRVMDTRSGLGVRVGRLSPEEILPLRIDGVVGGPATTVFLNLTAVGADEPGYVTAWPCDQEKPTTSMVNFFAGAGATPNMAVLAYPAEGVCFSASTPVHLVVDITAITTAGEVSGIAPNRLLDTREGQSLTAGIERAIPVAGTKGVPADAAAAAVNVTIVQPASPGFAVVKPCGSSTTSSTVNFMGGDIVAHLTFSALSAGSLCIVSSVDTQVVVDAFAWASASSTVKTLTPDRMLDTRSGIGAPAAAVEHGATVAIAIGGVDEVPDTAGAATVNLVGIGTADGFLTAWPCDADFPLASTVNLRPNGVASNQATIKLDAGGRICVRPETADGSSVHIVADVVGYIAQTSTVTLPPPVTVSPDPAPLPETPDAVAGGSRANATAGTTVGSRSYPIPAGALIVSPSGNDAWPGTTAQPLRTVARAIAVAPVGATIVLRGGTYFESINVSKRVTIQNAPGEAVWFDGSTPVTGWVANGSAWKYSGWTIEFDTSPTYTRGAADLTGSWSFLDPAYPLAAHPDQLFIDGIAMRQVATRGEVVAGTFFHDRPNNALYVGSNPIGHDTRASALIRAIRVTADGAVLKGFGVRRYAPSVPDMGSVTIERSNVTLEHVAVAQSATTGISVAKAYMQAAAYVTLRNVWVAGNGFVGIHGNFSDGLTLDNVLVEGNNVERFKPAPAAAGMKITAARQVIVRNSVFRHNYATGLWFDQSNYDLRITASDFRNNLVNGVFIEISAQLRFVDNVVTNNGADGLLVNNTSNSRVWNNTFVGNLRNVHFGQDDRRPNTSTYGQDPRYPNDPTMTWLLTPVEFSNNVVALPAGGSPCLMCFDGYMVASSMGIKTNGNVYNRASTASPSVMVYWSTGRSTADRYANLAAYTSKTGNDAGGRHIDGPAVVTSAGVPTAQLPAASAVAQPLPSDLATLIGRAAGVKRLGAWT